MPLEEAFEGRHSIRKFKEGVVPQDDIVRIIRAAGLAPSAANRQAWHFVVVRNSSTIKAVSEAIRSTIDTMSALPEYQGEVATRLKGQVNNCNILAAAPVVIAALVQPSPPGLPTLRDYDAYDYDPNLQSVAAAIEHVHLMAHALGYGTVWMTGPLFAAPRLEAVLKAAPPWRLAALIPLGVPAEAPAPRPRRPVEENITYLE